MGMVLDLVWVMVITIPGTILITDMVIRIMGMGIRITGMVIRIMDIVVDMVMAITMVIMAMPITGILNTDTADQLAVPVLQAEVMLTRGI